MREAEDVLPRSIAVIEKGLAEKLHVGAQLYVSLNSQPVADCAVGLARTGVPMTTASLMTWHSTTKCTVAVSAGQLWEQGKFDLDDQVCQYIPEFGTKGKDAITIRHILTHTGGFRIPARPARGQPGWMPDTWEESIANICDAEMAPGWIPGQRAAYTPPGSWIMAEIIRRLDGRPFERYVREEVFEPLGMENCWVGMPVERYRAYGDLIADMFLTQSGVPQPYPGSRAEASVTRCIPGGNGRGPMNELGRLFEMLLQRGTRDGVRLLSPPTVEAITTRHVYGLVDETCNSVRDWALFLVTDYIQFGRHCSPRAFGHAGAGSSVAFGDPEYGLAVALIFNGMPERVAHERRMEATATAIYEDLGLVAPGSPGRDHPVPGGE